MAADPTFVQNLHQLLQQTTTPDTATVKAATEQLQALYKKRAAIPALFQILVTSPEAHIRQLAAVELKKRLANKVKSWEKQPPEVRAGIKSQILGFISKEETGSVRNGAARVISEIASEELPKGTWPELLPFLFNAANSPNAGQRQISVFIFFTLLEVFSEDKTAQQYLPQIMEIFSRTLNDPESLEVRVTTVRGLGKVADFLEIDAQADLAALQGAVPQMVQVLSQCLQDSHSEGTKHVLDVFDTMCLIEAPVLTNFLGDLLEFYLVNAANDDIEEDLRCACLNSAVWTCTYKRQKVQQLQLAASIIPRMFPIIASGEVDLDDMNTPSVIALRLLDTIATEYPPSQVWPVLSEQVQNGMGSSDPSHRRAAIMALGICTEGVSETMRPHMDAVWSFVASALKDADSSVRTAGCSALTYLCDVLGDECVKHHAEAMPLLMQLVGDQGIQSDACRALDAFLENLGDDVKQYLPLVMQTLAGYLETASLKVKRSIIAAIGSAAHASGKEFTPYYEEIMKRIQPFLTIQDKDNEELMDVRAASQDAIGTFSIAVGKEVFRPYFSDIMGVAYQALSLGHSRLNECSFIFFSTMSKVFEEEFSPFLGQVMPKVIESLRQPEHDAVPGADGAANGLGVPGSSTDPDDEEAEEEIDWEDLEERFNNVNSAIAIEKEVAADAVGEIFKYTKSGFLPYLQDSVTELVQQLEHYSSGNRKAALASLFVCITTLNELVQQTKWQPGRQVKVPLNSDVQQLIDLVIDAALLMWEDEDDRLAAIQFCESLSECITEVGPAVISKNFEKIAEIAVSILEKKSLSQNDAGADEEAVDDGGDSSEYENVLIAAAMDLIGSLSSALGPDFAQPLQTFLPHITKYYAPTRSSAERASAISSLGEITSGMKADITPFTQEVLTILSRALSDPDTAVRSNATYASGLLIEKSSADLSQHFGALLQALQPSLQISSQDPNEDSRNLRDNACGCLARLVLKKPEAVPLEQVLPLLFGALPLLEDVAEWAPVMQCCISLLHSQNPVAMQNIDTMLQLFSHVLSTGQTPDSEDVLGSELRGQCVAFISQLNTQVPEKIQAAGLQVYLV